MSTYLVAMRDANSKTLAEDHGPQPETDTEQAAKRRYRGHVRAFNEGRYAEEVAEIALIRVDDGRRRSTLASTRGTRKGRQGGGS